MDFYNYDAIILFMSESIIIMGCKNTGKTTHGKALSQALGFPFLDTDYVIQKMKNMPYEDFYKKNGIVAYTQAEEEACNIIAKYASDKLVVISTRANIYDNPPALNALRPVGKFVFIHFTLDYCISKSMTGIEQNELGTISNLPKWVEEKKPKTMEDVRQIFSDSFSARFQQYASICDEEIVLTGSTKEENFDIILNKLK